jgi:predicted RNA-binding protein YlqC (UPF0109 family)
MPTIESHSEILLRAIVEAICKRSKDPTIRWNEAGSIWLIQGLDDRDQGRLIGKGGMTFYALETCMWYAGLAHAKHPEPVKLISQPRSAVAPPKSPFKPNPKWNRKAIGKLVDTITTACLKMTVPWSMEESGENEAVISIQLEKYLQTPMSDPDFALSLETLIHASGMSDGASITVSIIWK